MKQALLLLICIVAFSLLHAQVPVISTIAGNGIAAFSGDGGMATSASLYAWGVAMDKNGNTYIADGYNNRVRKISASGVITTFAGGGTGGLGDGGPATAATLFQPNSIAVDGAGNVYISDGLNNRVRKVSTDGTITTVAGGGMAGLGDGGLATDATLSLPSGIVADTSGNIFFADQGDNLIRKVTAAGIISTVAGGGIGGDGSAATSALLNDPYGLAMDAAGNIYIAEFLHNRVRKVTAGIISTVAGGGTGGLGDGGAATSATLNGPAGITVDGSGNLYIADFNNNRVRKVTAGIITTIAGGGAGALGDGGPAAMAVIDSPNDVKLDGCGNIYIADYGNFRLREINTVSAITSATVSVCPGAAITVSDTTAGGAWSSNNTAVATISSAGLITGVAGGTASVFYTSATGCASFIVRVPVPTLTGALAQPALCYTDTFNYTPADTFSSTVYTWARPAVTGISNPFASGAGSVHEVLTDTTNAPVVVSYIYSLTVTGGCSNSQTVTVTIDPLPVAGTVSGTDSLCAGIPVSFTDSISGGAWSSSNTSLATISSAGLVTGISSGAGAIVYTFTNACGSASASFPITVLICPDYVPIPIAPATVQAYPNPNNGTFTILISSPLQEQANVVITNITGQEIMRFAIATNKEMQVAMNKEQPAGLYFITITTASGRYLQKIEVK